MKVAMFAKREKHRAMVEVPVLLPHEQLWKESCQHDEGDPFWKKSPVEELPCFLENAAYQAVRQRDPK